MKKIEKIRAILLCSALGIIAIIIVLSLREKKEQIVVQSSAVRVHSDNASVEMKDVVYSTVNRDNETEWRLKAASARYYDENKKVLLKDLAVDFFLNGKTYHLTGSDGEFDTVSRNVSVSGNVVGTLPDGTTIRAETIMYDHNRRAITSEDKIVIMRDGLAMEGVGMVVDLANETLSLLGDVKALGNQ